MQAAQDKGAAGPGDALPHAAGHLLPRALWQGVRLLVRKLVWGGAWVQIAVNVRLGET